MTVRASIRLPGQPRAEQANRNRRRPATPRHACAQLGGDGLGCQQEHEHDHGARQAHNPGARKGARGIEQHARDNGAHGAADHLERGNGARDLAEVGHAKLLGRGDGRRDGAHARSDTKARSGHNRTKVRRREAQRHTGDNTRNGTQHVAKAQTKTIVDGAERNLGDNDRNHIGRKHGARPHGVVAARDDLGAVDGNARHVRNLVGQDGAIDKPHKEEGDDKQPKRRALLDARPANVNLGRRALVLVASRRDGRIARVLAERLQANLGRLGAEGIVMQLTKMV